MNKILITGGSGLLGQYLNLALSKSSKILTTYNNNHSNCREFLNNKISLTQLAKKHNLSVNGLKKILANFTYISKIKFDSQVFDGNHPPLISSTLFNHVQNKLEKLGIKPNS